MKAISSLSSYLKYLVFVGIALIVAGLVAGVIGGDWSLLPVALIVIGGILLVVGLGYWADPKSGFWQKRSTQGGTNAFISTLAVIVILGLVNFLAVQYEVRVDLTENKILTLADQSQEIVRSLEQPLKVWIFDRVPNTIDRSLLEKYSRYGSNFNFEYANPEQEIGLAQEFGVNNFGEVYLEYGEKQQLVQTVNEFERLSEIRLTNAIEQIRSDRAANLYFLQGHGEAPLEAAEGGLSQAVSRLQGKGYTLQPLNLAEATEIPQDADTIVIASPQRPLLEGEVTALQDYLNNGGSLFVMVNPNTETGLDPIFEEWGVQLEDRVIIDGSGSGNVIGLGPATPIVTEYGTHPITRSFGNGISIYPLARPIQLQEEEGIEATPLAISSPQSWAESDIEGEEVQFDPDSDREGPLNVGVALSRPENGSQLVVFGNSTFATDGWFEQQLNGDVFLNTINWLSQDEEGLLSIRPREPENRRIYLTPFSAGAIAWIALLIMPLLGFITATVMWWRRR